jgi:succinyl-CoA synthetase alpha subunit
MLDYGTKIVAGVTPGKGGMEVYGVPVFNTMEEAVRETGANTSIIYVPAKFAPDAIYEAIDAGIKLIVVVTEGIPVLEMMKIYNYLKGKETRLIGPNTPGIIAPGITKVGIMPGRIHIPGPIGVISRSGTLTYEVVDNLTKSGFGQSTCMGIGGDPIVGMTFVDVLPLFEEDPHTEAIVMIGEIGGTDEELAAEYIDSYIKKPVVSFIAGKSAPPGKRMGHAGAIISEGMGTASSKINALKKAGVKVAENPTEIPTLLKELFK